MSYKVVIIYLLFNYALAHGQEIKVTPRVENLSLDEQVVTLVYLTPGYATAIRMPEEITSVVVGDPAKFKAEHSESESRLVLLKPVATKPAESNALIGMKSGKAVSLHLVSSGTPTVDDSIQQSTSSPHWQGKEFMAALGQCVQQEAQTAVGFSVVNRSKTAVELLPPQIEISGRAGSGGKQTRAEPIALSEYRMTLRRLQPGERVDGVAVFERPAFKESDEKLELRLAQADQVNHRLVLTVPFIAMVVGGSR